jgi:uncharacterized protein YecE (DUF72 family)
MGAIVGTAGWSIPAKDSSFFPREGTALQRYAQVFGGVEVNSSFHRSHRPTTWEKWGDSVPEAFRFAAKLPKTITHQAKLVDAEALTEQFLEETSPLGRKLAVLLVQLPPKLAFDPEVAKRFFSDLRARSDAAIACEPRNLSWFDDDADGLLAHLRVARVAADPARCAAAGWRGLAYWRLHGSPVMYRSSYADEALERYAEQVQAALADAPSAWCMFDNTASSQATGNALALAARLKRKSAMVGA